MEEISLKDLLEAGCHFGHQVTKSNPRSRDFVYQARGGIQIIDLAKTRECLAKAAEYLRDLAIRGGQIIFVGTKRQAKGIVEEEAKRAGVFLITERWIGGTLTNWEEIKKNIDKIGKLEEQIKSAKEGEGGYTKREILLWERELVKLMKIYGGIRSLEKAPDALFIVDTHKEDLPVKEAIRTGVKLVGIVDTNADPDPIDYPIPANDDATGSIKYITHYLAEAVIEGRKTATTEGTEKAEKTRKIVTTESKEKKRRARNKKTVTAEGTVRKQRKSVVARKV